ASGRPHAAPRQSELGPPARRPRHARPLGRPRGPHEHPPRRGRRGRLVLLVPDAGDGGAARLHGACLRLPRRPRAARANPRPGRRVLIVNADEGEPGTIKDRYVMELRPHLLVEGIEIAMRFAEAEDVFVYLREEYATARQRLEAALAARNLPVTIVSGAGSYI